MHHLYSSCTKTASCAIVKSCSFGKPSFAPASWVPRWNNVEKSFYRHFSPATVCSPNLTLVILCFPFPYKEEEEQRKNFINNKFLVDIESGQRCPNLQPDPPKNSQNVDLWCHNSCVQNAFAKEFHFQIWFWVRWAPGNVLRWGRTIGWLGLLHIPNVSPLYWIEISISSDRTSYSDVALLYIQLFQIFTQSIDAIDVTSVTLSHLNQ